jgi:hypothetical protein
MIFAFSEKTEKGALVMQGKHLEKDLTEASPSEDF